ncbi:hypothetical protein MAM1_0734c11167 [Mucor ambiguus]|uniref:RhoGAP-domain-containing protein n=1 Tax=Mucor ambiguus TaxID=91626 RepID=A0A0C9MW12_9FUNG|nr:hypothetical protein MAM1_0734c11167 [Mucor ambiguus]
MNTAIASAPSIEMKTIDDYKIQNDQYWIIIEKQRLIIKAMQKSLNQLTSENERLVKRNKELESSIKDSSHSASPSPSTEPTTATSTATATTSASTPAVPPRSPYRINHNYSNRPSDTSTDLPKRPPVLKLAMSNHAQFQNRAADQPTSTAKKTSSKAQHKRNLSQTSNQPSNSANSKLNIPVMSKSKSEPSTPAHPRTPRYDSLHNNHPLDSHVATPTTATAILRNLSNINVKVIASINTNEKGFIIGILQKEDGQEIWRIEKSLSDLMSLDSNLKSLNPSLASTLKKLPDKSLFATHSPTKNMTQDYLQHAITLKSINNDILCEFLSTDRIHNLSITLTNDAGTKEGYLTKKGKNFGGWKSRYFMLDHSGTLRYYESKNGTFLGNINLINSQIASQPQYESKHESHFRHAFLIVEPKLSGGSHSKHIFCADSDAERDSWVDALRFYTNQLHITEDIINSSFATDDSMMTIDHLVVEPSSSTESNKSSVLKKRPSMDYILNYFQQTNSSRRRSSTSKASSPTTSADSSSVDTPLNTVSPPATIEEHSEEHIKKLRHKSNRKTFWGKKMFSSHTDNPISPIALTFGTSDYEETCGPNQIFGIPLENAVSVSRVCDHYDLPAIIHRCIEYLEARDALTEEGIYRLSGSAAKVKILKKRFNDAGDVRLLEDEEFHDVHAIAGLLKMWLRELPENILTEALLGDFLKSIHLDKEQSKICEVGRLISTLPLANYTLLRSLCAHLIRVIENSDKNKMTLKNISIVFSATLGIPSSIFNMLLKNFDYIFWTDRCDDQQVTEDAIKIYMAEEDASFDVQQLHHPHDIVHPVMKRVVESSCPGGFIDNGRSRRNSIHYKDNTPKEFISLEKQLDAVLDDSSQLDDDVYYSDGELEVAYFASRYNANSKTSNRLPPTDYVPTAI